MPVTEPSTEHWIDWNHGGISEAWNPEPEAAVVYRCAWDDRYELAQELLGYYPEGSSTFGSYTLPAEYPPSPNLRCVGIQSITPDKAVNWTDPAKWSPYKWALITAVFRVPPWGDLSSATPAGQIDPPPGTPATGGTPILFWRQRVRASAAFKVLPKGKLKFSTSLTIVETEVSKPAAQAEITLEFPKTPFNPYQLCRPYLGKINDAAIFGHAAGCVLFDSIDTDVSSTSDGSDCNVVLSFLARDASWNTLVNDEGEDELVEFDGAATTTRPFTEAHLHD